MKRFLFGLFTSALLVALTACSPAQAPVQDNGSNQPGTSSSETGAYHKISAEEAKKKMDEGGVTIVDVRTESEYMEAHIPGASLIPNETIGDTAPEALPDKEATLLVYCRSGRRSKEASQKLVELGYQNVYDFGGILDWSFDTVSE